MNIRLTADMAPFVAAMVAASHDHDHGADDEDAS